MPQIHQIAGVGTEEVLIGQSLLEILERAGHREFAAQRMHDDRVPNRLEIQHIRQLHAHLPPAGLDEQRLAATPTHHIDRPFQLLAECEVRHRLEQIGERLHFVPVDRVLRGGGDEHDNHSVVALADAPGRRHAVHVLHLDVQKQNVVHRRIILDDLLTIVEYGNREFRTGFAAVLIEIVKHPLAGGGIVLDHSNPDIAHDRTFLSRLLQASYPDVPDIGRIPAAFVRRRYAGDMEQDPLVSIIIPVYKVEKFLDECVASVAAQTYANLEILLVDDGSPDNCPAMCDAWAARDPRIRVIHKPNGGLSDARNAGIAEAIGAYIYFADSDDTVAPTLVEDCLNAMREYDADLVMFQFDTISENNKPLLSNYRHNDFTEVQVLTPVEAIKKQVKAEIDGYFWAFLAPASTYQGTGFSFPVGRKIEDLSRICNVIGEATRVVRLPKALYHYRMREGSITASWDPQLTRDWTRAADDREEYIVHRFPELKGFMTLQQLNFFANLDYETMRQSLIAGLKIDPEDADALRRRIEGLTKSADEGDEPVPETLRELLGLLKLGITKVADGTFGKADGSSTDGDAENDDVTLADRFRDMREDWRQLRIQRIEDAEERKAERKAARNGVTFESVSH